MSMKLMTSKKVWIPLLVLLAIGGGWYLKIHTAPAEGAGKAGFAGGAGRGGGPGGKGMAQTVKTAQAKLGDIPIYLTGLGTVAATNTAIVRSRVDGELIKLHFTEGQTVKAGQLLAELDPRSFQVALAQAQGQWATNQASLLNARADEERYKTLLAQDSVARQKLDTQVALVRQLEGTVAANKAAVDAAKLQLDYSRIKAPISGRLGLKQVDVGNQIHAGDANGLVVITQTQPINVVFTLPEAQLQSVLKPLNDGNALQVQAWDRDMKQSQALGQLVTVDNQIDIATGTVKLKATFPNTDNALFPNQFVNARIQVDTLKNAVLVPVAAVQLGKQGNYVWLVDADNKVSMQPVTTGPRNGELIVIREGVKAGDLMVTDGVDRLTEGGSVKQVEAAAPWQGAAPGKRGGKEGKGMGEHRRKRDAAGAAEAGKGEAGKPEAGAKKAEQ